MTPYEIIMAPFEVWLAPVGESFPLVSAVPGGNWEKLGTNGVLNYSEDGVVVRHGQTLEPHRTLGSTGAVKVKRTEEELAVEFALEDLSVEQYGKVLNDVVLVDTPAGAGQPGTREITLRQGSEVSTFAVLVRGPAVSAYGDTFNSQYQVRRAYQGASPEPTFTKGGAAALAIQLMALEDLTAATPAERFGKLVMQYANPT